MCLQCRRPQFSSWVGRIPWRRDRLPSPVFLGFPCGSAGKEPTCNAGDLGLMPGLGRSPREEKGYPLQYSGLENSTDSIVHEVANSQTQLSDFHFTYADDTTLITGNEEELRSLLVNVKEKSEKAGLELSIQKTKIMASGPSIHGK